MLMPSIDRSSGPALYAPNPAAANRFIEYFAANIRNIGLRLYRSFRPACP
jgi:hypothetical protein